MARFKFDQDTVSTGSSERISTTIGLAVRGSGLLLLLVGLVIAGAVILRAWSLMSDPAPVAEFARAIEAGSHLDLSLAGTQRQRTPEKSAPAISGIEDPSADKTNETSASPAGNGASLRLSYFVAWLITLLLLVLVGRLSIAAIKTGGQLALYDTNVRKLARQLSQELRTPPTVE